jgi:hypothetical protein
MLYATGLYYILEHDFGFESMKVPRFKLYAQESNNLFLWLYTFSTQIFISYATSRRPFPGGRRVVGSFSTFLLHHLILGWRLQSERTEFVKGSNLEESVRE